MIRDPHNSTGRRPSEEPGGLRWVCSIEDIPAKSNGGELSEVSDKAATSSSRLLQAQESRSSGVLNRAKCDGRDSGLIEGSSLAIVPPATPSPKRAGGFVPRRRFQRGRLIVYGIREPQWCGIYREDVLSIKGTVSRVRRTVRLGPVDKLSERAARAKFQPHLDRVNSIGRMPPKSGTTLQEFVKEWRLNVSVNLKPSTARAVESHLRAHIVPMLGILTLSEVNTKAVQIFATSLGARGLTRKTIENILLTLSSIVNKARAWGYACGNFSFADLTLPRNGVKREPRSFTVEEAGRIIASASEPFATIWALVAMLGLRIGEVLALRESDLAFEPGLIRVRQSVDSVTRKIQACKSDASCADVPMPLQLKTRLQNYLVKHFRANDAGLLFVNKHGRPYSGNKLREKQLHPLLIELGIPKGGFHAGRHGATSSMLEGGASPAVGQKQMRHSDPRKR
jgi:integrase